MYIYIYIHIYAGPPAWPDRPAGACSDSSKVPRSAYITYITYIPYIYKYIKKLHPCGTGP